MNRATRILAAVIATGLIAVVSGRATFAAFTSTTANPANAIASGTVVIADNDAGNVMWNLTNQLPTSPAVVRCIRVTYSGTLPATVRLYTTTAASALDPYLNVTVEKGTMPVGDHVLELHGVRRAGDDPPHRDPPGVQSRPDRMGERSHRVPGGADRMEHRRLLGLPIHRAGAERVRGPGPDGPGGIHVGGAEPMKRIVRLTALLIGWIVLGAFGGLLLAVGVPNLFHAKSLTVMSGSMEPTISTGDVVVAQQISPMDARVGDIVSFRDPLEHDRVITHRVRVIHVIKDKVEFVTKGDANTNTEHWAVPEDGTIGRVAFHVPRLGYFMVWIHSTFGLLLLIVLPTLILGATELWNIWRPRGAHEPGAHRRTAAPDGRSRPARRRPTGRTEISR